MSGRDRSGDRPKSAAELMGELQRDPGFLARQKEKDDERRRSFEANRAAAKDLLAELADAGFEVAAVGDLRRLGKPYPKAVPTLVRWLPRVQYVALKEDIIRTLSVPWAREARQALLAEFERADDGASGALRWAIGNALEVLAADEIAEDMIKLAINPRYGKAREMIVLGLGKLKQPRVVDVLTDLLHDEEVVGHAVMALGRLRAHSARPRIEPLLRHPKPWVRREAKKALARMKE